MQSGSGEIRDSRYEIQSERAKALIRLRGLTKVYATGAAAVHALAGIDLDIRAGEYVGVMGPSGSGKTTLMDIVGCLSQPTSGTYELDGEFIEQLDANALATLRGRRIGFVFQAFNLLPRLSAAENVELPLLYQRVPRRQRRQRAIELLQRVGLGPRGDHKPNELSGGERQRVAIARALINNPPVILADEPTGALDTATGNTILELLESLHREGHTLIVVTHDPRVGERVDRVLRLKDGRVENDESRISNLVSRHEGGAADGRHEG